MVMLLKFFGDYIAEWPTHTPELSTFNYFLWLILKNEVYHQSPAMIEELKKKIEEAINTISHQTLKKVLNNLIDRAKACKAENGKYFEHLLYF